MVRFDFKRIYVQTKIYENLLWQQNARAILDRYPQAEIKEVEKHWAIDDLFGADAKEWIRSKKEVLILGVKSGLTHTKNGRSADYIAASMSNGCLSSCQYCYVARHKGGSNPLTLFVNIQEIADSIEKHSQKLGPKLYPNQTDSQFWTYDIGCNGDLSLDAAICDHPRYMIERFAKMPYAKATFATKTVHEQYWLKVDPKGRTRIRYSLMPQSIARSVDIRTSPISERIASTNRLVEGGYEVHFNFSPIILYSPRDQFKKDWIELFQEIDDVLSDKAKKQLSCEAFFLSHSTAAHEANLQWNAKGEEYLWSPGIQVAKRTKPDVLVYDYTLKAQALKWFEDTLKTYLPYCPVRYSF